MVREPALQSVDLGFNPLSESYQKTSKNGIHSFPAWRLEVVRNKPPSSLVVSLDEAIKETPPLLYGRQVAQTARK